MPVHIQSDDFEGSGVREAGTPRLRIGLVNNMGASAFEATERQFVSVLARAAGALEIELWLYALPGVFAAEQPAGYRSTAELLSEELDALLVTGREPIASDLRDEPYWADFTALVDWARDHTLSTVWSCLAAHAAVLYSSGIGRHRLPGKHCGIDTCTRTAVHPLTASLPQQFRVPHSRWNGLRAAELADAGYLLLSQTATGEVDACCMEDRSLFVFFQGHPEYEADTLLREYRRDVGRWVRGQSPAYPDMPCRYFDRDTEAALASARGRALAARNTSVHEEVVAVLAAAAMQNTWHASAALLYASWLQYLCVQKSALAFSH